MEKQASNSANVFSVAIVGHQCGKSQILSRFLRGEFSEDDDPTVEDSYQKTIQVNGEDVKLDILDTSGSDSFTGLYSKWFNSVEAFIIVYSITSMYSFDFVNHLFEEIEKIKKRKDFPAVLVGTQSDQEENRRITYKEGLSVAFRYKIPFIEVSAKTGDNIEHIFSAVVDESKKFRRRLASPATPSHKRQSKSLDCVNVISIYGKDFDKLGQLKVGDKKKKKWVGIKNGILYFYENVKDIQEGNFKTQVNMLTCTVKPIVKKSGKDLKSFQVISITKNYDIHAESPEEMNEWILKLQDAILSQLNNVTSVKEMKEDENHSRRIFLEFSNKIQVKSNTPEEEWRDIQKSEPANYKCADCNKEDPDWCSINLGILVCIQCSGIHRSMGVHVSKVRSLTLDKLDPQVYKFMRAVGNSKANKIWENNLSMAKPNAKDDRFAKEKFVRAKYESKKFLPKSTLDESQLNQSLYDSVSTNNLEKSMELHALGANINWVNPINSLSILHKAAMTGNDVIVTWILHSNNVNSSIKNLSNQSPIDVALLSNQLEIANYIRKKGGTEMTDAEREIMNATNSNYEKIEIPRDQGTLRRQDILERRRKLAERRQKLEEDRKSVNIEQVLSNQIKSQIENYEKNRKLTLRFDHEKNNKPPQLSTTEEKPKGSSFIQLSWTLTVKSDMLTYKTKVDPSLTVQEFLNRIEKKFPSEYFSSEKALFVESALYFLRLEPHSVLKDNSAIQDNGEVILEDKEYKGTRVKPSKFESEK